MNDLLLESYVPERVGVMSLWSFLAQEQILSLEMEFLIAGMNIISVILGSLKGSSPLVKEKKEKKT